MTTARQIISGALRFHLNRLAPGETLDADTADVCLEALNHIADELNGVKSFLFREVLTSGTVSGTSGTLGTTWATLSPGDEILGATVQYSAGMDTPLNPITMAQYANIAIKSIVSIPRDYAHDGAATVYFYPAAAGQTVTLRTREVVSDFATLDTDYTMPKGYKAHLSAMLADRVAPSIAPAMAANAAAKAAKARSLMGAQSIEPGIIGSGNRGGNIYAGW